MDGLIVFFFSCINIT